MLHEFVLLLGSGILSACLITLIAASSIGYIYPSTDFPTEVSGCSSFAYLTLNNDLPCPSSLQAVYANEVLGSAPIENNFIWRSVVATGSLGALVTLFFSKLFLVETPRFTSHTLGEHLLAIEDLASQVRYTLHRFIMLTHPIISCISFYFYFMEIILVVA